MAEDYTLTADVFSVPYKDDSSILYAPRLGFACLANSDLISLIAGLESLDPKRLNSEQRAALEHLKLKGLLNHSEEYNPIVAAEKEFAPDQLTLFPTNQCNLRCIYCYASAGEFKPRMMDWQTATSAVEFMISSVKKAGKKRCSLAFHGGGEPLYPWAFVKRIVEFAEERCAEESVSLAVFSATNGVLSEKQLEWIIGHMKNLNISFDGLPHVQDYHRPLANGKGSFEFVDRTLRFLDEKKFSYGLRGTVSSYNVGLMKETVAYIGGRYMTKSIHLEPLFYCGRCKTSGTLSPEVETFAENFMACEEACQNAGINLIYSGAHIDMLHNSFCGVSGHNFSVTPDGHLTTCYEVTDVGDPRSKTFFFGKIGPDGAVRIDEGRRRFLNTLTVENLDYCRDCFAKWHCAGECPAKLGHGDYRGDRGHERCRLNRRLIANRLHKLVEGKSPKMTPQSDPATK